MRELEFLPDWYNRARRKRRVVVFQAWVLALLVAGFGGWIALAQRNIRNQQSTLGSLKQQLDQTYNDQRILADQLVLRQELQTREKLIASLGFPVEMTRMVQTLDKLMPKEMSIVELTCNTDEQVRQLSGVAAIRAAGVPAEKQIDRRLKVKMLGVSPSDLDLGNFLAGLASVPFFDQVGITYSRDKIESGHIMREFEITFSMNLNQPAFASGE
jgi:hypothetical protein